MSPSWIWSDKITNERVARVGYNHFISNKGEWNDCFSKFLNRVLPPISISTILQSIRKENLAHYFPYDVKLRLFAHSRSFLANQEARNAIVGAENLLILFISDRCCERDPDQNSRNSRAILFRQFFKCCAFCRKFGQEERGEFIWIAWN